MMLSHCYTWYYGVYNTAVVLLWLTFHRDAKQATKKRLDGRKKSYTWYSTCTAVP